MRKEKALNQFGEMLDELFDNPDAYPDNVTYLALSQEEREQLLTPKRIQLLKTIRDKEGLSVSELADEVERDIGAVSKNLKVLSNHDIIDLNRRGHRKEAAIACSHIIIPLRVETGRQKRKVA